MPAARARLGLSTTRHPRACVLVGRLADSIWRQQRRRTDTDPRRAETEVKRHLPMYIHTPQPRSPSLRISGLVVDGVGITSHPLRPHCPDAPTDRLLTIMGPPLGRPGRSWAVECRLTTTNVDHRCEVK